MNTVFAALGIGIIFSIFIVILLCIAMFIGEEIKGEKLNNEIKKKSLKKSKTKKSK
jgi:Na+-transporting methylmalonyl-CoA/oxaloacetate decarboxylase gamma subunit